MKQIQKHGLLVRLSFVLVCIAMYAMTWIVIFRVLYRNPAAITTGVASTIIVSGFITLFVGAAEGIILFWLIQLAKLAICWVLYGNKTWQ